MEIQLRSYKEEEYVVLEVVDNGKGFDLQKNKQSIFEPFSNLAVDETGLGRGLYLVKTIVEKNGGYLEIESTPRQGTVVRLYLKPALRIR